jgi:paraquat-inducible protein B
MNKVERVEMLMAQVEDLHNRTEDSIDLTIECLELCVLLVKKNIDYGSSAISPIRIFSKANPLEQINVRIDDKLSRINNSEDKFFAEDVDLDLAGYLMLRRLVKRRILESA